MTTTPPDHCHYIVSVEDENGVNTKSRTTRLTVPITVAFELFKRKTFIDAITTEFRTQYNFDVDANTESLEYNAVLLQQEKKSINLTITMRSCYCTPLNENQPTPF